MIIEHALRCARHRKISWFAKIPINFDCKRFSQTQKEILVGDFWEFFIENGKVGLDDSGNCYEYEKFHDNNGSMTH